MHSSWMSSNFSQFRLLTYEVSCLASKNVCLHLFSDVIDLILFKCGCNMDMQNGFFKFKFLADGTSDYGDS